jgi:hypothetical protein
MDYAWSGVSNSYSGLLTFSLLYTLKSRCFEKSPLFQLMCSFALPRYSHYLQLIRILRCKRFAETSMGEWSAKYNGKIIQPMIRQDC